MAFLDMRTIFFIYVLTTAACLFFVILLWQQSRKRFAGSTLWVFDFAFQLLGLLLVLLRGSIPDWASIVLANVLIVTGMFLGYLALLKFVGKKSAQAHNYIILIVFTLVHFYFTFVEPVVGARSFNASAGIMIMSFQCAWLALYSVRSGLRPLMRGVGMVFSLYCLANIVRMTALLAGTDVPTDFFRSNQFEKLFMVSYHILLVLLTFALVLMFNKRLILDISWQEEKFSKAFQSAPYAMFLTRLSDGQIIEVNDGFLLITGYELADVKDRYIKDLHLWGKEEDRTAVLKQLLQGDRLQSLEFQFRNASGEEFTGLFSAERVTINNEPLILSSINDITHRVKIEAALREANRWWRETFDATNDAIWIMGEDQRVLLSNKTAEVIFHRRSHELIGKHCWEIVHGSEQPIPECPIPRMRQSLRRETMELQIGESWFEVTVDPILDEEGRYAGAVHSVSNITDRKQAAAEILRLNMELERKMDRQTGELRETQIALLNLVDDLNQSAKNITAANQSLESVNKELAAFSYSVSHDLRAPLRSIDGFSNALMEDCGDKLNDEGKNYLHRIRRATQHMGRLIDDMLNLSRVTRSEFRRETVNLSGMVEVIAGELQRNSPSQHIDPDIQEGVFVQADGHLLRIVMTNLLDNAWKFTGKSKHAKIEFGARMEDGKTVFFVRDNGAGFDMKYAGKLFSAFQRLHNAEEYPGTGIGLATVQRIIHRHGGRIWVEGEVGKGATFYFTLEA